MMRRFDRLLKSPLHPTAIGLYPILALAAENSGEIQPGDTFRLLASTAILLLVLSWLITRYTRQPERWLLVLSFCVIAFNSYGHLYNLTRGMAAGSFLIGRHRFLLVAVGILSALWLVAIFKKHVDTTTITQGFNAASLLLLALPVISLLHYEFVIRNIQSPSMIQENLELNVAVDTALPDIYYIVLDSYAREDIMRELYGFDNQAFTNELRKLGFYVADQSNANHSSTAFSLTSSLNFEYIQSLDLDVPPGSYPYSLMEPIRNNRVMVMLKSIGYKTVATASGTLPTSMTTADIFLTPEQDDVQSNFLSYLNRINPFEEMYIYTTLLRAPLDLIQKHAREAVVQWIEDARGGARQRSLVLSAFDQLEQMPSLNGPKFVFVHILSPHRPYLFTSSGEPVHQSEAYSLQDTSRSESPVDEFNLYREQLLFINTKVLSALESIIEQSEVKPVIILQADHGPEFGFNWHSPDQLNLHTKFPILNAYYLPERCQDLVYASITPVNSFRVVFNCLFDTDYQILADHSYFSNHHSDGEYEFIPIESLLMPLDTAEERSSSTQ